MLWRWNIGLQAANSLFPVGSRNIAREEYEMLIHENPGLARREGHSVKRLKSDARLRRETEKMRKEFRRYIDAPCFEELEECPSETPDEKLAGSTDEDA